MPTCERTGRAVLIDPLTENTGRYLAFIESIAARAASGLLRFKPQSFDKDYKLSLRERSIAQLMRHFFSGVSAIMPGARSYSGRNDGLPVFAV